MDQEKERSIHDSRFTINEAQLPKEMREHTYAIMNRVEDSHWWFVGRRAILESFLEEIAGTDGSQESEAGSQESEAGSQESEIRSQVSGVRSQGRSDEELPSEETGRTSQHSALSNQYSRMGLRRILDVGCGTGANLEMLSRFGNAEGVDVSDEALTFCKSKGLRVHKGLAEELPFDDETFDIVTGLDVIEHLDDDIAGLSEMNRVLKKGGKTLIFVPAFMKGPDSL
jgi:SAM-dependent methyltransferase